MDLWPYKDTKFFMKFANFIMLYTGDFVLRYYGGFSQIRSHMYVCTFCIAMLTLQCTSFMLLHLPNYQL